MDKKYILLFLLAAIILALVLSPFASPWPDGLERVAEDKGFIEKGDAEPALHSPIADYLWPGIKNDKLATALAGLVGTLFTFVVGFGLAKLLGKIKTNKKNNAA